MGKLETNKTGTFDQPAQDQQDGYIATFDDVNDGLLSRAL